VARIPDKVQLIGDSTDEEMNLRCFYLTLPSNALMQLYPSNTAVQYTIKLPRPINLDGRHWEVALTELSVPSIFDNVVSGTCYIKLTDPEHLINNSTVNYIVEPGHYNEDILLSYLNHQVANDGILFVMENGKVELLNSGNFKAYLSSTFMNKLGFVNMLNDRFGGGRHIAENHNEELVVAKFCLCTVSNSYYVAIMLFGNVSSTSESIIQPGDETQFIHERTVEICFEIA